MADTKITGLQTPQVTTNPATDVLPIVNIADNSMAASGSTRKITVNQLLGAGGTATLASATISGDLTVRTNKLAVTSTGVAVGATSAAYPLDVTGIINTNSDAYVQGGRLALYRPAGASYIDVASGQDLVFRGGLTTVGGAGASDLMRLNSTGLGVGVASTSRKFEVHGTPVSIGGTATGMLVTVANSGTAYNASPTSGLALWNKFNSSGTIFPSAAIQAGKENATDGNYAGFLSLYTVNSVGTPNEQMRIDSSGNVGIGVTPSAWVSYQKSIDFGGAGNYGSVSARANFAAFATNCYFDGTNWIYKNTNPANLYEQSAGANIWRTAPSGTAGNAITFDQAMTLDASGNLLVGTTGLNGSWNTKLTLSNDSGTTKWAVGPYLGGVTNFLISASASAGVYLNGTAATSWTSASDERLKDIIEPISNAIAKVGSLRAVIGKFKFDENNTRKPFLIAQDIQAVLPEAVDASNPEKLGVAYTDVIPLLVAAIKELTSEVNALKNA